MIRITKIKQKDRKGNELYVGDKIKIYSRRHKEEYVIREIVQQGNAIGIMSLQGMFCIMYYFPSRIIEKVVSG